MAPSGVCGSGVQHSCVHLIGAVSVLASSRQGSLFPQPGLGPGERGGAGEKASKRDMFVVGEYGAIDGVLGGGCGGGELSPSNPSLEDLQLPPAVYGVDCDHWF